MTDEEYLARLGLLRLQSGKRKPQEPVPAGSSVLDVPVGGTRRIPDTVLRRQYEGPNVGEATPYDPTLRERLAAKTQDVFEGLGADRYKARQRAETILGGPSSNLPLHIGLADFAPFLGTTIQTEEAGRGLEQAGRDIQRGDYLSAGIEGLGAGLGLLPGLSATAKGAKAVGKRVREAADPEAIRQYVRQTQGLTGMPGTAVIKPKGGNWLTGSVERQTEPIKARGPTEDDRAWILEHAENQRELGQDPTRVLEGLNAIPRTNAINNWIDKKLNKYIRNQMGTPEDPVRKLAEEGVLHYDPIQVSPSKYANAAMARQRVGMSPEGMAQSELANKWETIIDSAIDPYPAKAYKRGALDPSLLEQNPWLQKVDDEAMVYNAKGLRYDAGFGHLIDELRNAINPNSDLPANLRWKPEDLDKVTMEQAVKRVHDINEYRAAKKAEANEVLARNPATAPYRDYQTVPGTDKPNEKGLAWKQIKQPGELPEGFSVEKVGSKYYVQDNKGQGYTLNANSPEEAIKAFYSDKRFNVVESALKYEGEVMGHCVGGYCDDVLSGRSQIFSLRDKKGEPHVTIEVEPTNIDPRDWFYNQPYEVTQQIHAQAGPAPSAKEMADLIRQHPQYIKDNEGSLPNIVQIKGKGNRAPKEEYLPFVQDFVRSGNWSRVGDIQNTGLFKVNDKYLSEQEVKSLTEPALQFITETPALNRYRQAYQAYTDFKGQVPSAEYSALNRDAAMQVHPSIPYTYAELESVLKDPKAYGNSLGDVLDAVELLKGLSRQGYASGGLVQNTDTLRDKLIAAGMDPEQAMTQALRMADQVEMAEGGSVKAAQDWRRKLVGGGIRGIVTRGLLGMDPPEDMTPRERDIYENMVRLSAPAQGLGVGKAIFIGAKAKTWNKSAADRFVEMEKAGVSPEKMWRETGTFRGADGKLRQEISDVGAIHRNPAQLQELGKAKKEEAKELQLRMVTPIGQKDLFPKALTEAKKPVREQVKKLKDEADELMRHSDVRGQSARFVLEHPELYKAYPELADIPVMQGVSGSGRGSLIGAGPDLQMSITQQGLRHDPKSTALHEMQHAVQALEEMAPGGSPAMAFQNPKAFEILQELRAKASTPMSFEKFVEQYGSNANNADRYEEYLKSIPQTVAGLEKQLQQTAAMEYYKRLAGEAEARATQFREKMGPTQRLQEFPYSSYDVLPEDLIVRPPKGAGMGEGMQAGGLAKAAKAAATELKGKYKALPLDLPRASAMTQQEIEQIAERIARQQLGEHVRKPGDTKNLAGRSLKEAERLKKLSYSLESTKTPPLEKVVPEKKGQVRVALPGDISVADKILVEVEGLPIGALQQGGPKYGAGKMDLPDPRFWASNVGPASNLQRKIDDLAMVYETPEVLAQHMAMGSTGMNFAQHLANANLMAINSSMPHPKAVEQFNKVIRKGFFDPVSKTQVEFPDFPGVENYKASYQALKEDPELRKWFNNRMKTEDVTAPLNFPRGKDIEYAISEPELRDLEIGMTGLSVGQMQPGASLIKQSAHKTYSHDIPGLYLGRTQELLPVELAFPDASAFIKSTKRPADFTTTMQKVFPHQVVDEQYINELGEYYDKLRKIRGFNEGGVVKPEGADDFAKQVMQKIANQQVSA